jgi:hypothetical protein
MSTNIIEVARGYVGRLEDKGRKNRAGWIDEINLASGIGPGNPYCASGLSYCFIKARRSGATGRAWDVTGSSQRVRRKLAERGLLTFEADKMLQWRGAVGGWTNPPPDNVHGHVFAIEQRLTAKIGGKLRVVAIITIEFNTDGVQGDRDGDGCYRLKRELDLRTGLWYAVDPRTKKRYGKGRRLWFGDVSLFAGGTYWPEPSV